MADDTIYATDAEKLAVATDEALEGTCRGRHPDRGGTLR